jgi:hypothetical protein
METLVDYLKSHKPKRFVAKPYYSADGDSVTYFFKDNPSYAQRVDDFLTVYLSIEGDELVGCQVKGVARLLKLLGEFGVTIEDKLVKLGMFFMAGMAETPIGHAKEQYRALSRIAGDASVSRKELEPALAGIVLN